MSCEPDTRYDIANYFCCMTKYDNIRVIYIHEAIYIRMKIILYKWMFMHEHRNDLKRFYAPF